MDMKDESHNCCTPHERMFSPVSPLCHMLSLRGFEHKTARGTQHGARSKRRDPDRLSVRKTPAEQDQVCTKHHSSNGEQTETTRR